MLRAVFAAVAIGLSVDAASAASVHLDGLGSRLNAVTDSHTFTGRCEGAFAPDCGPGLEVAPRHPWSVALPTGRPFAPQAVWFDVQVNGTGRTEPVLLGSLSQPYLAPFAPVSLEQMMRDTLRSQVPWALWAQPQTAGKISRRVDAFAHAVAVPLPASGLMMAVVFGFAAWQLRMTARPTRRRIAHR